MRKKIFRRCLIFVVLPRPPQPYDHIFVRRVILLVLLVISCVVGLLGYLKYQLLESAKPQRVNNWIHRESRL